jgi:hypothetical protein
MYWEGQKDIEMDNKDEDHHIILFFMVHIIPVDEKSMQRVKESSMEVDLDENCSCLMTCDSKQCSVSNHETLKGKVTHQGAWELMALI